MTENRVQRLTVRHHGDGALEKVVPLDEQIITRDDINAELDGLPEEEAIAIRKKLADGMADIHLRERAVSTDGKQLREKLGRSVQVAVAAHQEGLSVTETTTHDHGTGRTELIVGNTTTAERGKLSDAQRGTENYTLWYVIIAALVIVALAMLN